MQTELIQLQSQLAERQRNLRIIEECIQADSQANEKLLAVRDFLRQRIKVIEEEIGSNEMSSERADLGLSMVA